MCPAPIAQAGISPQRYGRAAAHPILAAVAEQVVRPMKVAVFGKPGGGKSTLSQKIAIAAALPLYQLDMIQFRKGGARVPDDELARLHADILVQPRWVLDGFGTRQTFEAMLRAASVLVYVERASWVHYWYVTNRFLKSPFA